MRVYVTELCRSPQVEEIILSEIGATSEDTFLYVPIPKWTSVNQLDEMLYRIPSHIRRAASCSILRAHHTEAGKIQSNDLLRQRLDHRFEGLPIYVLYSLDGSYAISGINLKTETYLPQTKLQPILKSMRHAELMALTRRAGAFLPPSPDFHYEGPNESHYKSFLRVGTAFQSVDSLDAVSFWLVPYMKPDSLLLVDSSTLLSIGLNAKQYVINCGLIEHPHAGFVECLRSYDEPDEEVIRRLDSLRAYEERLPTILLLVSVSSSGRLVKRVLSACEQAGYKDIKIVSIYSSPSSDVRYSGEVFCQLHEGFVHYDKPNCELCKEGSPIVRIEPNTYRLEVSASVSEARIKAINAKEARDFFDYYSGLGSISVHKDQHDGTRHHMLHIDVCPLLKSEIFLKRLGRVIGNLQGEIDVLLAPTHHAAVALASKVASLLEVPILLKEESELLQLEARERAFLSGKRILLVDDVVITGARVLGYRNYLLRAGLSNAATVLHFLVGVERPANTKKRLGIVDMVGGRFFHKIETITLPNWLEDECPWCWELKQIINHGETVKGSSPMLERYNLLRSTVDGVKRGLFLHWASVEERDRQLTLGPGSVFGSSLSDVEVFAAVASAVQNLRNEGELNEQYVSPVGKVLEPERDIETRYYDPIITASILRAVRRCDLRSTRTDLRLSTFVHDRLIGNSATELRSEIMLAIAQNKLPRGSIIHDRPNAAIFDGEPGVCSLLKAVLSLRD